jgi:hypothetical protein
MRQHLRIVMIVLDILGGMFFLLVGICGCLYPFLIEKEKKDETN